MSKKAEQVIPTKEELISDRKILKGLSEEFYLFGTMTRYDFDKIEHALNFTERCKKDGILTYDKDCNELRKIQLPYSSLYDLLDSMPTEQTMWSLVTIELKKMQVLLERMN